MPPEWGRDMKFTEWEERKKLRRRLQTKLHTQKIKKMVRSIDRHFFPPFLSKSSQTSGELCNDKK
jgi:hypothetical protein